MPGHLHQARGSPGVRKHAVHHLGQAHARILPRDAHVAEKRPLEGSADHPAFEGHENRGLQREELLRSPVPPLDELEIADPARASAEFGEVAARRKRLAVAPPHHGPQALALAQLAENLPEPLVHLVVGRVVLFGPVVAHDRHRTVELERDRLAAHRVS